MCVAAEEGSDMTVKMQRTSTPSSEAETVSGAAGATGLGGTVRKLGIWAKDAAVDKHDFQTRGNAAEAASSISTEGLGQGTSAVTQNAQNNKNTNDQINIQNQLKPVLTKELLNQIDQEILHSIARQNFPKTCQSLVGAASSQPGKNAGIDVTSCKSKVTMQSWTDGARNLKTVRKTDRNKTMNERSRRIATNESNDGVDIVIEGELDSKLLSKDKAILIKADVQSVEPKPATSSVDSPRGDKEDKQDDDVVWICFVCAKGFPDQCELMAHQETCEEDDSQDGIQYPPLHPGPAPGTLDVNLTGQNKARAPKQEKCLTSKLLPPAVPALLRKVGSGIRTLPLGLPNLSKLGVRRHKKFKDIYIPPSRDEYFTSLGLGPTKIVQEIFNSPRKPDMDCQIIDLTLEESPVQVPPSPMTPRSRSLISQMSRDDGSARKRHLSFSQADIREEPKQKRQKRESSSESESSDSSEEERGTVSRSQVVHKSLLFGIPLTSPLGQRLKKHWRSEFKVPVISDPEIFCNTDDYPEYADETAKQDSKNLMMEKLRHRPPAQVTFKFTKKYLNKWFHSYKFNRADKREFEKTVKAGLGKESRLLKKQMRPCRVVLKAISKKEIVRWTTRRKKKLSLTQYHMVPYTHTNSSYRTVHSNVNQSVRYSLGQGKNANMVYFRDPMQPQQGYSTVAARLQHQNYTTPRLLRPQTVYTQGPTPQLLVRTVGQPGNVMLEVLPMAAQMNHSLKNAIGAPHNPRSQKRKQVFDKVRNDDNLVICLSSDEDEEVVNTPSSSFKQRLGPASFMRKQTSQMTSGLPQGNAGFIKIPPRSTVPQEAASPTVSQETVSSKVFGKSFIRQTTPTMLAAGVQKPPDDKTADTAWAYTRYLLVNGSVTANNNPAFHLPTNSVAAFTPKISDIVSVGDAASEEGLSEIMSGTMDSTNAQNSISIVETGNMASLLPTNSVGAFSPKISKVISFNEAAWGKSVSEMSPVRQQDTGSQSESEIMDYEVICLDSDDDD